MSERAANFQRFLEQNRLDQLVALTHGVSDDPFVIYDTLAPFLTARRPVAWAQLDAVGAAPREMVRLLAAAASSMSRLDDWHADVLETWIAETAVRAAVGAEAIRRVLVICILFSEDRLPLVRSLVHLGRDTCLQRLQYAARGYESFHLIG